MNADRSSTNSASGPPSTLLDASLTRRVIGCFYEVYNELGNWHLESVYAAAFEIVLAERGIAAEREAAMHVHFRGRVVGQFRADFLVERKLIVELKALPRLTAEHDAQLINYLKTARVRVGLLLNFGPTPEFRRRVLSRREG